MKKSELMKLLQSSLEMQNELVEWVDKEIEAHFDDAQQIRAKYIFEYALESYDENNWLPSLAHISYQINEEHNRAEKYRAEAKAKADAELKEAIYKIPDCQNGDG